jgi:serine/threonine protein kinase
MTEQPVGSEVAGYRIESVIGRGGMAIVYRAEDTRLGRKVALKVLSSALGEQEQFQQRFIRESRLAASLDHPNIIPIYEAGNADGLLFIAMRYVVGSDLKALLQREDPLPPARALRLLEQIGDALDAAHQLGLVHRDVKPGNVLITSVHENADHVYLTDFGLTKRVSSLSGGLTGTGHFLGTIDYVAPEQIAGKPVDARADMYALGCVLYECLTGQPPFHRDDDAATLWAHLVEAPPPVTAVRQELSPAVEAVVSRAMAKAPEDRYPSCHALALDLSEALDLSMPLPTAKYHGSSGQESGFGSLGNGSTSGPADLSRQASPDWESDVGTARHPSFPPGAMGVPAAAHDGVPGEPPIWISETPAPDSPEAWQQGSDSADEPEPSYELDTGPDDSDVGWAQDHQLQAGRGRRHRRWLVPTFVLAVVVALAAVAAVVFWPSRSTTKLALHYASKIPVVPFSMDYPNGWEVEEGTGSDVILSPHRAELAPLFFQRGTGTSWSLAQALSRSDRSHVVGSYALATSTAIDRSNPQALEDQVLRSLPRTANLSTAPHAVIIGGAVADELEGESDDPNDSNARLHLVIDVVQTQHPANSSLLLVFFAAPDKFQSNRSLFDKMRSTIAFSS